MTFVCVGREQEQKVAQFLHLLDDIICSKTHLDAITHAQVIIHRQSFASHMVNSWPMINETEEKIY